MHLNRDQSMAISAAKEAGFNPIQAIVLTGRHRQLHCGVVSVSAIKDGARYNLRVTVDARKNVSSVLSAERLTTIVDNRRSSNVQSIDGCVVRTITRTLVN